MQKAVFNALSPGGFLFVRYLIMPVAAALLLCSRYGTRWPRVVARRRCSRCCGSASLGHLLHVGLVTYGIHWSTAFSSSLILACGPVFTLLILHWHGHERADPRPGRRRRASPASACSSFLSDKLFGGHWRPAAATWCCWSRPSFFSYYTVAAKPLIERLGGVTVMTYAVLLGSAPVVAAQPARRPAVSTGARSRRRSGPAPSTR